MSRSKVPFVTGGVYGKNFGGGYRTGVLTAANTFNENGLREATLHFHGIASLSVVEARGDLDEWELLAVPVAVDELDRIRRVVASAEELIAELDFENAVADDDDLFPDPSATGGPIDPLAAVKAAAAATK